jgi:uncharacterized protein (TIGR02453 family)
MKMEDIKPFTGFSRDTVRFLGGLRRHNNREWFEGHRAMYDDHLMAPSKSFVAAMGQRLREISPRIVAVPRVNGSIFRLNRDTRFSSDPTPYKTNLGIYFWIGPWPRLESAGYYFHLEPPDFMLGGGIYIFPPAMLGPYRRAAADPRAGKELAKIVAALSRVEGFSLGGSHYKRVPAGMDPGHPNAELFKHNALYGGFDSAIPEEFYSAELIDYCFEKFRLIAPLNDWLMRLKR